MPWRWFAALGVASSVWVTAPQGQQLRQSGAPAATESRDGEISTQGADTAIKVQVNLVPVRVVVKDTGGKLVPGLKQEDFQLFDNGKRQRISTFSVETAEAQGKVAATETRKSAEGEVIADVQKTPTMPQRFLALVFDDLHLKVAQAMSVRAATEKLFASLTPTDRVAIYSTKGDVLQDFTGDAETLRKTLAAVIPHPAKGEEEYKCPNVTYYQADLIVNKHDQLAATAAMVDATENNCLGAVGGVVDQVLQQGDSLTRDNYRNLEGIVRHLASMPGQRVLVYVSPGFTLSDQVLPDAGNLIERAVRAGVVVNTIDAKGMYTADLLPDIAAPPQVAPYKTAGVDYQRMESTLRMQEQFQSGQVLAAMAASTGGTYFHNRNDLDVGMSEALAAPGVSYVLGFTPDKLMLDGKFHTLKVKVANGKKYQLQARNGYYASKILAAPEYAQDVTKQEVTEALFSQGETVSIPVQLKTEFLKVDENSSQLTVFTRVDVSALRFRKEGGRSCSDVLLATGVFDTNGQLTGGQMKDVALKLTESTLEKMSQTGLMINTVFTVKPGTYTVRTVVRGSEGDQLTARNLTIVIPREQPTESKKTVGSPNPKWDPPKVDVHLKSLLVSPSCDLWEVLEHAAASSLVLASNLEKFTAQEHIEYFMLNRAGMVLEFDSGSFQYAYAIEQKRGGIVSQEFRSPLKGGHAFGASDQDIGAAALALIFHPDLQPDYEMNCEGIDTRNGQLDWVVHFQQRKDKPSRTAKFRVNNVPYSGMFKGRAWISMDSFQVVHLEANLMGGLPQIGLEELALSVDYDLVHAPSGNISLQLPNRVVSYWDFSGHRIILAHSFADFQLFTVETNENIQPPKEQ